MSLETDVKGKEQATGNTLLTFPKIIYSLEPDLVDVHPTKIDEQYGLLVSMPAYKAAVVGLD